MAQAAANVQELHDKLVATFSQGITRPVEWRLHQLNQLLKLVHNHEEEILDAVKVDLGRCRHESFVAELGCFSRNLRLYIKNLRKWLRPEKASGNLLVMPCTARVVKEPLGTVLILAPWNYPVGLSLEPLAGAIMGGNTALVKPSELAPTCSALLARLLPVYVDTRAVAVVEGGQPVGEACLALRWDKIFYTGGGAVGRAVLLAAARHLTPVCLELGGKNPAYVDDRANLQVTVNRLCAGRFFNAGQSCIAPDYVMARDGMMDKLITHFKAQIARAYGQDPKASPDLGRIINARHFQRITRMLEEPGVAERIIIGGQSDAATRYIAPTLIMDPPADSTLWREEIFGPILLLKRVANVEEAIAFGRTVCANPLSYYLFTSDKKVMDHFENNTVSGQFVVNDIGVQYLVEGLPFGGRGESGMGAYHGRYSLDEFVHRKAVLRRSWIDASVRYPPYTMFKETFFRLFFMDVAAMGSTLAAELPLLSTIPTATATLLASSTATTPTSDAITAQLREIDQRLKDNAIAIEVLQNTAGLTAQAVKDIAAKPAPAGLAGDAPPITTWADMLKQHTTSTTSAVAAQLQRQTLDLREEAELAKRSLNVIVKNLKMEEGENSEKLARAFEREILDRMGLTGEIELAAHRLPRARGKAGPPPLLLTFKTPADKISFLRRRKRLEKTLFTLDDDLTLAQQQRRRELWPTYLQLRQTKAGQPVYWKGAAIYVGHKPWQATPAAPATPGAPA
eukprot:jgi/Mesvir1/21348/Mv20838-RA.1